jgi:structural maintenance of chromosome 4
VRLAAIHECLTLIVVHRQQSKPDAKDISRMRELEKKSSDVEKELETLRSHSAVVEKGIQALEKKILDIGGSKLLAQKSKVDGIKLHINLANDEITRAEVAKAKAEKDVQKLATSIASHRAGLEEVDRTTAELEEQLEEVIVTVAEIRSKMEQAQAATENAKDDLDDIKSELDEQAKIIQKFRAKEVRVMFLRSL